MEPAYPSSFLPHFYLALIGIPSCFFIGILISPCWFSTGMKFCEIISEPFILVFQFVNRCMPWMLPVSEVYTLENKINYHWKNCYLQVTHIFCAFAHMLERPFYVRWGVWLYSCVPPKCLSSPPPSHNAGPQWRLPLSTSQGKGCPCSSTEEAHCLHYYSP